MSFAIHGDIHCKDCNKKYRVYTEWSLPGPSDKVPEQSEKREICKEKARKEAEKEGLELIELKKPFKCPEGHKLADEADDIDDINFCA